MKAIQPVSFGQLSIEPKLRDKQVRLIYRAADQTALLNEEMHRKLLDHYGVVNADDHYMGKQATQYIRRLTYEAAHEAPYDDLGNAFCQLRHTLQELRKTGLGHHFLVQAVRQVKTQNMLTLLTKLPELAE